MKRRCKIDVIRTDVLLYCLEGFAESTFKSDVPYWSRGYSLDCWKEIVRIASKDRSEMGEIKDIADRFGRNKNSLAVLISKIRNGHIDVPQAFKSELRT